MKSIVVSVVIAYVCLIGAGYAQNEVKPPPPSKVKQGETWTSTSGIKFIGIPDGYFMMGLPSPEEGKQHMAEKGTIFEKPQHMVLIRAFWMGANEVTQHQYQSIMGGNPSASNRGVGPNFPVNKVSWYDALVFCNRLSIKEGLKPVYTIRGSSDPTLWGNAPTTENDDWNAVVMDLNANGYRLPTEAEWEYACRANTKSAYAFGDAITESQANFDNSTKEIGDFRVMSNKNAKLERTQPVGSYKANGWGLYDMHGNLAEWCWDKFDRYPAYEPLTQNPVGPSKWTSILKNRVIRGGSWSSYGEFVRSASRLPSSPESRNESLGFRLARSISD